MLKKYFNFNFAGRFTPHDLGLPEGYSPHHHYDPPFQTVPSSVPPSPDQWAADLSHTNGSLSNGHPNSHHHQNHPVFAALQTRESPLPHLGHVQNSSPGHVQGQQGCDVKPVIQAAVLAGNFLLCNSNFGNLTLVVDCHKLAVFCVFLLNCISCFLQEVVQFSYGSFYWNS